MQTKRLRILMSTEASSLLTGFSKYTRELLKRLYAMDKYDLAEFASFSTIEHANQNPVPWKHYPNHIEDNHPDKASFDSNPTNVYGAWRFDRVCLHFKPDIVFDIRDPWMMGHEYYASSRPYFHHVIMPTVDSAPQRPEWIEDFNTSDAVFTYSDWGGKVLQKQSNRHINWQGATYCGADEMFVPVKNKYEHRKQMGFVDDPNAIIIGTIMRNQKRKLYPELFKAFRLFLDKAPQDIAKNTYLYVHTGYPDGAGWDIPSLIQECGLGNKVLFTYICRDSKKPFCCFMQDARTYSPFTHDSTAVMPGGGVGLDEKELANIIQVFDLYVQYSITEGLGMPMLEAAACGIPIAAVDYSAMEDIIRLTNGYPIKVRTMFREFETGADRAYPDGEYFVKQLIKFANLSKEDRDKKQKEARKAAEKYFNWDRVASLWSSYFDSAKLTGKQGKWDSPPDIKEPERNMPNNLNNKDFVRWCYNNVSHEPERLYSYKALSAIQDLNYGASREGGGLNNFSQQFFFEHCSNRRENLNSFEKARCGILPLLPADYLECDNK